MILNNIDDYKFVSIESIEDNKTYTMDIEVENEHAYILENGAVSHNSVSCLTQTTSGIEPVFKISYTRRRKIDKSSGINPDFIDKTGDWFINFNVVHNKFILWYSIYKNITFDQAKDELEKLSEDKLNNLIKESPYYKATAMDCDWMEKVKMQGALQKYVDHSISCCLDPNTLIETNEGLKYLDELYDFSLLNDGEFGKSDSNLMVINMNNKFTKINSYYNNGIKDIYKVNLTNGLSINATYNEKFLVYNDNTDNYEWKMLIDLCEGDRIKLV